MAKKSKPVTLVVRRGALRRFDRLKQATRELPADVIWDRRGKGTSASGNSSGDVPEPTNNRRKTTPSTWDLADFLVTEDGPSGGSDTASEKSVPGEARHVSRRRSSTLQRPAPSAQTNRKK